MILAFDGLEHSQFKWESTSMKLWKTTTCALVLAAASSTQANAAIFDIDLTFNGGLSASQQQVFSDAEAFWESHITGYIDNVQPFSLAISATGDNIDGQGGILGSAGPRRGFQASNFFYATEGEMTFDSSDLSAMENNNTLYSVIVHEMAHVIGFGSLWTYNNIYNNGTGQYTGAAATAAYKAEFDPSASFVPVELDGGQGTEDAHWDESWAGPSSDIMTGYLEGAVTISQTTLASFEDLGYIVSYNTSSEPPPASNVPAPLMGFVSLGVIGLLSLRRKQK